MNNPSEIQIEILERPIISCDDVEEMLGDYVEGDLIPTLHARLANHIDQCECCRQSELEYRAVIKLASALRNRPLPSGVKERLRDGLKAKLGIDLSVR